MTDVDEGSSEIPFLIIYGKINLPALCSCLMQFNMRFQRWLISIDKVGFLKLHMQNKAQF